MSNDTGNGKIGGKGGSGNGAKPPGAGKGGRGAIRAAVTGAAEVVKTAFEMPAGFEMRASGLWRIPASEKDMPYRICGPFEVAAESRPERGDEWGLLLRWKDRDGTTHEWIMPRRLLAGEAAQVRERLMSCGLDVSASQGARLALVQFLAALRVPGRVRTTPKTGWYLPANGSPVFVLPGRTIGEKPGGELVRLDLDPPPAIYTAKGTLDGWRAEVAGRCTGNSRLSFGVSASFAAVLLHLAGDEGGGINLRGESSKGKTTIIDAAASVCGAPSKTGAHSNVRAWRSTSNALESTAAAHNHMLLPMDEMGQADPKELGETLYMLANGSGKSRARAGGGNRPSETWLTLVLSSSEESAGSLMAQAGKRVKAGQEVRLLDVPAVVPGGFGCFDVLHGEADGAAFSQAMRRAVTTHYGTAAPAFLEWLAARLAREPDFAAQVLLPRVRAFKAAYLPRSADGQVHRAADRFALVAVAGEMATEAGITGWPAGEAERAVGIILRDWLLERGGVGSREDHHLFAALRRFMALHGSARFETVKEPDADADGAQTEPPLPEATRTIQRAGWRWQEVDDKGERRWLHGIIPEVFDAEIAGALGLEPRDARARLGKAGLIRGQKQGDGNRWTIRPRTIPGNGRPRLVVVEPAALDGADE
jgi:putative DNA primase/helicase